MQRDSKGHFIKGHTTNLGRVCSIEKRNKIAIANKGKVPYKMTDKIRDKMSQSKKGHLVSPETRIKELEAQNKEFAEKERLAKEAQDKITADKKVADEKIALEAKQTEIKNFCDETIKAGKMTPAMREKDEPIMFELSKTNIDALKSFQQKYNIPVVPLGETKLGEEITDNDKRPLVIKQAAAYVKLHKTDKEFAELSEADAINRAVYLHSMESKKYKFEDETKSKGAK